MNKVRLLYLNTSVTWQQLMDWDEDRNSGPLYAMMKVTHISNMNDPVVCFYAWSTDKDLVERFLTERNRDLFILKTIKLDDDEFVSFRRDYCNFMLIPCELPSEYTIGELTYPDVDDFVEMVATRIESGFVTDSTDARQFLSESFVKNALYSHKIFKNPLKKALDNVGYFNNAVQNIKGMYQLELYLHDDDKTETSDLDDISNNKINDGIAANMERYSVLDGTKITIGNPGEVYYMRLFKYAFWYTYIDTVPDYSMVYHK